jgi:muramoyltetrapeptide carboxypeptidase
MEEERVADCVQALTDWGYNVKLGSTVGGSSVTYFSGTDEERAADLQQMLDDPEVKAILCGRGGYGTGRIIDLLSFKRFRKNPKWIIGFSDITLLHAYLNTRLRVASLHAPMAGAFKGEGYKNDYVQSLRKALEGRKARYQVEPHPLNSRGEAVGELTGGNLALLAHVTGTPLDIHTKNKILFLEDVGEYLYNIDRMLYQLRRSGKLSKLAGLIIGGFTDLKDTTRPFGRDVYEIIADLVKEYDYPVCFGFPVGHQEENYALKPGVGYKLKVTKNKVVLEE